MQHKQRTAVLTAILLGVAGTIQYHSTQFLSTFDTFFGDRGDARGFVYFCEHWYQSILGKASLLSPGIFYPTKRTLAYSDLLLGFVAPFSFLRALGFNMFTSVEIVIVLLTFLSFCVAFVLLYRTLGLGVVPSCAGAMFFAFNSAKFNQLTHLQLQYVLLLPLIFALVITFAKQAETIDQKRAAVLLSLVAVCLILQLATTFYYGWFLAFWSILFFLLALAFRRSRDFINASVRKLWPALLVSAAVFLIGFIPFVLIYLPTLRVGTWYRYDFISEMIPDWRAMLSMGDGNYIWGWFYRALMPDTRPATWGELMVGVGLVPLLAWFTLIVCSVWFIKMRRNVAKAVPSPNEVGPLFLGITILATTICLLIGFKYGGHSPWKYIYQFFPGAGAIRAVSRYVIFLTLPMSIALSYGLHRALEFAAARRKRMLTVAILLLTAFGVMEQFGVPKINGTGFSTRVEDAYLKAMAAKLANDCTAFYIAPGAYANHSTAEYQYDAMLISVMSRVKTLNASSSQFPPDWNLYFVKNPDYEANVKQWIDSRRISGKVCRLEIGPQVEVFDPKIPSLIDEPEFFVRQLYRDFAATEPDATVIASQVGKIRNCRIDDETCDRAHVALNIFLSTGFHERGFLILRMYEAGLGRTPSYEEFTDVMRRFSDRDRMVAEFAQRYNRDGQLLRQQIDNDELVRRLGNRSFVILHYFSYLRRDPDPSGVAAWQELLDRSGVATKVTEGFITSVEYRQRFRN
ncbi:MAG TPA: DUF4214 domain-containing protein [Pyrinomonadaceae bacterium]|jgi:hypothetical protein|nr:DUF4214 domain-containing protein [Pyrinomonadaceae bacterium]